MSREEREDSRFIRRFIHTDSVVVSLGEDVGKKDCEANPVNMW